jgi:hypothetical protein
VASPEPSEVVQMMVNQIRNACTSSPLNDASPLDVVSAVDDTQLVGA